MAGDPQVAAQKAGLTGAENDEILNGRSAQQLLEDPTLRRAFRELAAYYSLKQIEAADDVDGVMTWQRQRVALADVEKTLRSYLETGEFAQARVGRFRAFLERMQREPSRNDRFNARPIQ